MLRSQHLRSLSVRSLSHDVFYQFILEILSLISKIFLLCLILSLSRMRNKYRRAVNICCNGAVYV